MLPTSNTGSQPVNSLHVLDKDMNEVGVITVSYTHLDVYKRQEYGFYEKTCMQAVYKRCVCRCHADISLSMDGSSFQYLSLIHICPISAVISEGYSSNEILSLALSFPFLYV